MFCKLSENFAKWQQMVAVCWKEILGSIIFQSRGSSTCGELSWQRLIDCEPWSKFLPRRVSKVPVVRSLRNPFVCVTLAREEVKIWWTGFNCLLSSIIQLFFNYVTCGSPKQCKWRHFPWENLDMQLIHVLGLRIWRGQYKRKSWRWKKRRPGQLLPHFCQFLSLFCYFLPHFCQFLSLFATFCHYLSFFCHSSICENFLCKGSPRR